MKTHVHGTYWTLSDYIYWQSCIVDTVYLAHWTTSETSKTEILHTDIIMTWLKFLIYNIHDTVLVQTC